MDSPKGKSRAVGGRTGACSGIWVLDVDPRHGGDEALRELEAVHGPLPDTVESLTGGGGRHLIFKHPSPEWEVPCNSDGKVGAGLDVKGDGGYIVLPYSLHRSGGRYEWELVSGHPAEVQPAPAPDWLLEKVGVCKAGDNARKRIAMSREGVPIKEGARNPTLASMAGRMRSAGMGETAILAALLEANEAQCKPPLREDEVREIARSISRYEPDEDGATFDGLGASPVAPPGGPVAADSVPAQHSTQHLSELNVEQLVAGVSFANLILQPPPPRRWIIEGFMPGENVPTLIHAEGGSTKSFLTLYCALVIGAGLPLLDMPTRRHPVAYLDFEMGQVEQERRALAIARGMGLSLLKGDFTYFPVVGHSFAAVRPGIKQWLEAHPGAVLIIDSFGAASTGDIKGEEMVIRFMRGLRSLGAEAACIVDHQSKMQPGEDYAHKSAYGNVYKQNLSRMIWQLEVADTGPGYVQVFMRHKKTNFGHKCDGLGVEVRFDTDEEGGRWCGLNVRIWQKDR